MKLRIVPDRSKPGACVKGTANLIINSLDEYDILHNDYLTQLALLKIRQNEKIKLLANLFASY